MSFDAAEHRRRSSEAWDAASAGWTGRQEMLRAFGAPVSEWMLEAARLEPGQRVLELAGGLGDTGMLAAARVAPGDAILSDRSEGMLDGARARAAELGLANVSFHVIDAESIDLDVASVDAVLCRWGYMLMADPGAALAETRRVLRPGGRLALSVWDAIERNPWAALPAQVLREHGQAGAGPGPLPGAGDSAPEAEGDGVPAADGGKAPPGQREPGPFTLADRGELTELLEEAGFTGVRIEPIELVRRHASFGEFWDVTLDLSRGVHDAVMDLPPAEIEQVRAAIEEGLAPYTAASGELEIPALALGAAADA
jgi:SAM-dependent methyltransferase